jgi:hypothetical protein
VIVVDRNFQEHLLYCRKCLCGSEQPASSWIQRCVSSFKRQSGS